MTRQDVMYLAGLAVLFALLVFAAVGRAVWFA